MAVTKRPIEAWANRPFKDGDGVHNDIYAASCFLIEEGHDDETIFSFLRRAAREIPGRAVPDREIRSAIVYARGSKEDGVVRQSLNWPEAEQIMQTEIQRAFPADMDQLERNADELPQNPGDYLSDLFRPNELVCIASDVYHFQTMPLESAIEISDGYRMEFINPNPMIAQTGVTREGKTSHHCEDNTGPRVYLVIEFDAGSPQAQAAYHKYLGKHLPLTILIYSGGKSTHGWYYCEEESETRCRRFFEIACQLGADPKTWSICQFVRLPGGLNGKTGKKQQVIFWEGGTR